MDRELKEHLKTVRRIMDEQARYIHAAKLAGFDLQTVSAAKARPAQAELEAFLSNRAFCLTKDKEFIRAAEQLYRHREQLDKYDRALAVSLHREYLRTKKVSPKADHDFSRIFGNAFVAWLEAKDKADFSLFAPHLEKVRDVELKRISLMQEAKPYPYDNLLDAYEHGMTSEVLNEAFGTCKERLIPMLNKIRRSKKKIRTDFLTRKVPRAVQEEAGRYILEVMHYDFSRGVLAESEHPFTEEVAPDDIRVTTHYHIGHFTSSLFSVIHEGGHALFGQNTPAKHYSRHIDALKTLGMHESVSRFYENRIARTRDFVHSIYPKLQRIYGEALADVSEAEFYEGINRVKPSLIRTEADEFTYTFHIIIRYEMEQEILKGKTSVKKLPALWNRKYESYLGVCPKNDREGILQDVHWTSGFGYFPTYAIGNMYNAMYINRMKETLDIGKLIRGGRLDAINEWMTAHVFRKADLLDPADWIKDITGRAFTPDDFLDYLEEKYGELYGL